MFDVQYGPNFLKITMAAESAHIDQACFEVKKMLQEHFLDNESFAILLGMREALSNAIFHGCGSDSSRQVVFHLNISDDELSVSVEDDGPGFNWAEHSFEPPSKEISHGRGLSIIKNYFQQLSFNETGNRIVMTKAYSKGADMSEIMIDGDSATVVPQHDIVSTRVDGFKQELKDLVDNGICDITLDFSKVEMMDSIGMGLLIAAYNSLSKKNGNLRLINVTEDIAGLLRTMRLDKHFDITG